MSLATQILSKKPKTSDLHLKLGKEIGFAVVQHQVTAPVAYKQ